MIQTLQSSPPLLLLMRHAKSSWDNSLPDHARPLKKRGRRDAPRMGEFLSSRGMVPESIITSSAVRSLETAQGVAQACGLGAPIVEPRLYHADLETWRQVLSELPAFRKLLVVGHNPGLEEVLAEITDGFVRMPTGAVACLRLRRDAMFVTLDSLTLIDVWRPKEL